MSSLGGLLLQLVTDLSRARRQRDAFCSLALVAIDALAEARRELAMIDQAFARRHEVRLAELRSAVGDAYDGQPATSRREVAA